MQYSNKMIMLLGVMCRLCVGSNKQDTPENSQQEMCVSVDLASVNGEEDKERSDVTPLCEELPTNPQSRCKECVQIFPAEDIRGISFGQCISCANNSSRFHTKKLPSEAPVQSLSPFSSISTMTTVSDAGVIAEAVVGKPGK